MIEENVIQINGGITINACKKLHACEKDYIWNPGICSSENGKHLANVMDDSAITCDEVIGSYYEQIKTILTNCNWKESNL